MACICLPLWGFLFFLRGLLKMSEQVKPTPFNRWQQAGLEQPYGGDYSKSRDTLAGGHWRDKELAELLKQTLSSELMSIGVYTAAKERLRWLSQAVLRKYEGSHELINKVCHIRATLPSGELTDDELANEFFLHETAELRLAGSMRINFLSELLEGDKR
ncbi:hypothetical protein CWC12_10200 [Pseudoalteromonas ruthenica]|uniref:hypothetical protein n=2 Tax=Pseudoalteromonas ruthenica TaxID=151081 RepID=UPI0012867B54|nr:hypothetical protein [Pseudoalteromonas ruthenica]TMO87643.1 hypothetical protein CWC12_10200 [Pseudoalteromonas ruthenica]TMP22280.1 hypothetical protein CWC06_15810 [Pseudoalteromonas ruthenica]